MRTFLICAIVITLLNTTARSANLISNGDFEKSRDNNLPADWEVLDIGAPAEFSLDSQVKHGGKSSARITAAAANRVYFRSKPIPVAAGERVNGSEKIVGGDKITATAWVKFKDVPVGEGKGTIIMIAEFCRNEKYRGDVAKFDVVDRKGKTEGDWQQIKGTVEIPPLATLLRLRIGFSYS